MPAASFLQSSFIGGLVSKWTQGRYHDQHYRTWMAACLNGIPVETEAWTRRPGFGLAGTTRRGLPARLIKFDFEEAAPYALEFSSLFMRFWQSNLLATTNDSVGLSAISAASPAHITLASAVTWSTGDEVFFSGLGTTCPTLQNRRFTITKIDTTHFTLADAVTQAAFNGSGVGTPAATAMVNHVLEIATPYNNAAWPALRSVQTEQAAFLLHGSFQPQQLTVDSDPMGSTFATFSLAASLFEDGPYLDPFTNGVQAVPNQTTGLVQITLQFPQFVSTTSYAKGDFVTSSSVNYISLVDQNVGNTPASSPSDWQAVSAATAINGGRGFLSSDIGRLVRLFSEPAPWAVGTTYAAGAVVSYNPTGLPGGSTYWQSLVNSNIGNVPGTDAQNVTGATIIMRWAPCAPGAALPSIANAAQQSPAQASGPAQWTWGAITALLNFISGTVSGVAHIGNMTSDGGLSAAFDGNLVKPATSCAVITNSFIGQAPTLSGYVGQNYTGTAATAYKIQSATIVPSTDGGMASFIFTGFLTNFAVIAQLYGSNSAPSSPSNGTLLGSVVVATAGELASGTYVFGTNSVSINSSNQATAYAYVWATLTASASLISGSPSGSVSVIACQLEIVQAGGSATSANGCTVELLGPPLLYTNPIITWRLGLYSNTTGWPNVGTYSDGRLWLTSAAFPNRIDACYADGINGVNNGQEPGSVNFAPTDQYGNVTEANGISYIFNAPDANPIFWMIPDQQGILCGTQGGEWLIAAPTTGGLSPLNISARRVTLIGSANIEPRRTEHTIVFVQGFLRKIVEYFADIFSGKFSAPNLVKDAKQLTIGGLQELAYQQELCPIVWARVNNGLIGDTYKRDTLMTSSGPTMNGWHNHAIGGNNPRSLTSIIVGSAINGTLDALMAVTVDANNVNFVEVITPILDEGTPQAQAQYLDEAIVPSSFVINAATASNPYGSITLNGLWNLNGYTVTAWLGGLDCGDYTVANGSITVPFGDGEPNGQGSFPASSGANRGDQGLFTQNFVTTGITANGTVIFTGAIPMLVGNTYTSTGIILRANTPPEAGTRSGPAFGKKRRVEWMMAQFEGSQGVSWGVQMQDGTQNLWPVLFENPDGTYLTVDQQFTGIVRDNVQADYDFDNLLMWQVTRPYICNVQTIGGALETQDL